MERFDLIYYNDYKNGKNFFTSDINKYPNFVPNGGSYQFKEQNIYHKKLCTLINKKITKNHCDVAKFFTGNSNKKYNI